MGLFDGQTVIVTGAGGALGRAYALELSRGGANVVVNNRADRHGTGTTSTTAEHVVDEIQREGGVGVIDVHDVAAEADAIVANAIRRFGSVHAVINNAGNMGAGQIDQMPAAEFEDILRVHVLGSAAVTRAAWPHMREQGYGRIVNTTSSTIFGEPTMLAYATAKSALVGMTKSLAQAGAAHGIRVNCVMPTAYSKMNAGSAFDTVTIPYFPAHRVAPWVAALVAGGVPCSGEVFVVGGGRAARMFYGTVPGASGFSTAEEALGSFDRALNTDEYVRLDSLMEALGYELEQVGVDPAVLSGA